MIIIAAVGLACAAAAFALTFAGFGDRDMLNAIDRGVALAIARYNARPVYCARSGRWRDRRTMRFVKAPV